jgi:hypothetical protein
VATFVLNSTFRSESVELFLRVAIPNDDGSYEPSTWLGEHPSAVVVDKEWNSDGKCCLETVDVDLPEGAIILFIHKGLHTTAQIVRGGELASVRYIGRKGRFTNVLEVDGKRVTIT